MYLLKLASRPLKQAPKSQIVAVVTLSFLLFTLGLLYWVQLELGPVVTTLSRQQVLTVYLKSEQDHQAERKIVDSIRLAVGALPKRKGIDVKVVGSQEFLEKMKTKHPELSQELMGLGGELEKIVPRYISVAGRFSPDTHRTVARIPGVASAESSVNRYHDVIAAFRSIRWMSRILLFGLLGALLLVLVQMARIHQFIQADARSVLGLFGGGGASYNGPLILSITTVGALAGIGAMALWWGAGVTIAGEVRQLAPVLASLKPASLWVGPGLMGIGVVASFLVAIVHTRTYVSTR